MRSKFRLAGAVIMLAPLVCSISYLRYEYLTRPATLLKAGPLDLSVMKTDRPVNSILPPATGHNNAAQYYTSALNSYVARRSPYLKQRKLNPYAHEPVISPYEMSQLMLGSRQSDCDFYEIEDGIPLYSFHGGPGTAPWIFQRSRDPFASRPYIEPLRILLQALLNDAHRKILGRNWNMAESELFCAMRIADHLRQHPGSLMDMQLGLEIDLKTLHYLEKLYDMTHNVTKKRLCDQYGNSVNRYFDSYRRKFEQLANVEVARKVLHQDPEPLWRSEAAVALVSALHLHKLGWWEEWEIKRDLGRAKIHDADLSVKGTVEMLLALKTTDFRSRSGAREDAGL